jgi:hypothetical protein
MITIKIGLANNWKYARTMTRAAISGSANSNLVLGVKCYSARR